MTQKALKLTRNDINGAVFSEGVIINGLDYGIDRVYIFRVKPSFLEKEG